MFILVNAVKNFIELKMEKEPNLIIKDIESSRNQQDFNNLFVKMLEDKKQNNSKDVSISNFILYRNLLSEQKYILVLGERKQNKEHQQIPQKYTKFSLTWAYSAAGVFGASFCSI